MEFLYYFYLVTFLNGLVLIAALLFRKENRLPNFILSCLLAAVLFAQGTIVTHLTGGLTHYSPLYESRFLVRFLVPSLFYLYILSLTVPGFKWSARYWLHFLPFTLSLVVYLFSLAFRDNLAALQQGQALLMARYITLIAVVAVSGAYLLACFQRLANFQKLIPLYFSELFRIRLNWLRVLLALFTIPWLIALADVLAGPYVTFLDEVIVPVVTVIILIMGFFGLQQSTIFSADEFWLGDHEKKEHKPVYFSPDELVHWKTKLEKFMEEQKPYLELEYRLVDLAHDLGLKPYQVSEILNRGIGVTFFDFINAYRIEEAKRRLKDPASGILKILTIAMDSGFNSKSSFNDTFRKFTAMTPSQYRSSASGQSGRPV